MLEWLQRRGLRALRFVPAPVREWLVRTTTPRYTLGTVCWIEHEGNVLLVGWGSTQGPIKEAVDRARAAGDSVSAVHIKYINPLPPGLENIFAGFNHVLVVEMNDEGLYGFGQLGGLLRSRYCDPKIRGLTKTDGLTFKVKEILERVKTNVAEGLRKH